MKVKMKEKMDSLQQDAMKKVTDGIIDILLRMYAMDTSGCTLLEFMYKCRDLTAKEFYALPIKPKKGEFEDD